MNTLEIVKLTDDKATDQAKALYLMAAPASVLLARLAAKAAHAGH